jgi:hypothetical protein
VLGGRSGLVQIPLVQQAQVPDIVEHN